MDSNVEALINISDKIDEKLNILEEKQKKLLEILTNSYDNLKYLTFDNNKVEPTIAPIKKHCAKKTIAQIPTKVIPKSHKESSIKILNINEHINQESMGTFIKADIDKYKIARYVPHICSPKCLSAFSIDPKNFQSHISILYIPIQTGWNRILKNNNKVTYVTPCGVAISSYRDLLSYLIITQSRIPVDYFSFSENLSISRNFEATASIIDEDISNNQERINIPCVNSFDFSYPPHFVYSPCIKPSSSVPICYDMVTSQSFTCGCSCADGICQDSDSCECQRTTADSAIRIGVRLFNNSTAATSTRLNDPNNVTGYVTGGYMYRRLPQPLGTGIYECNPNCACNKRLCLNRVVQSGIRHKLQLFCTAEKGWGIRCLNDIPLGSFVCTYAGRILTDREAELMGYEEGDEYLAQIDFIECAEYLKQDYARSNNQTVDPDIIAQWDKRKDISGNSVRTVARSSLPLLRQQHQHAAPNEHGNQVLDENSVDETLSAESNSDINSLQPSTSQMVSTTQQDNAKILNGHGYEGDRDNNATITNGNKKRGTRDLFNTESWGYVMDAKKEGNIGRFLNHSCDPNLFVQNVFVNAHDIRFPAIALFANRTIRAGTELTWNYGYEIGSVKGKEIVCKCNSHKCTGRLL